MQRGIVNNTPPERADAGQVSFFLFLRFAFVFPFCFSFSFFGRDLLSPCIRILFILPGCFFVGNRFGDSLQKSVELNITILFTRHFQKVVPLRKGWG